MSFFDKINNYLIVNAIKEILKGRDPEDLKNRCQIVFKLAHSRSMWLTVSGRPQNRHVYGYMI